MAPAEGTIDDTEYQGLLGKVLPVVIRSETEYRRLMKAAEKLIEKPEEKLTAEEGRRLELLSMVLEDYEDRVRPLPLDRLRDAGLHRVEVPRPRVEPVSGLGEAELVEEDLGELRVVVLPGVHHDLVDSGLAQCQGQRRRFDELRTVPDDGEHFHGGYTTRRESGR